MNDVKIAKAKGRPMLQWVGKKPLETVPAYPAQHVESFQSAESASAPAHADWSDWPEKYPRGGLLFHGDNKDVLAHLLANGFRGKVKLIYIDPPFDSGADYVRKVNLRGAASVKLDGEDYSLGEQVQYTDIWANDNYLQFMYERLLLLRELLAEDGSIFLHCDPSRNAYLRLLLDETFGPASFINEVVWQRLSAHNDSKKFGIIHDTLFYYGKGEKRIFNPQRSALSQRYVEQFFDSVEEETGRRYSRSDLTARGLRNGETGKPWRGINPATKGNHWKVGITQLEQWDKQGRIHWPKNGGMPRLKRYLDEVETKGATPQDIWYDIRPIHNQGSEGLDYPTQKPEDLIERVIITASNPGDIVIDCFLGSGTTAAVAQKLGRRWIGCDINKGAIQTTAKRLQTMIAGQANASASAESRQMDLHPDEENEAPKPAQWGFTVWRVNDYDLQIQHNEAVQLVAEHLGLQRTKADGFFDGTLGNRLVKIVPFNHPLSPLDLASIRAELESRPGEERDVVIVALGMELAAKAWLDRHNAHRPENANRFIPRELRTDKKYGGIIKHEPATAEVAIRHETLQGEERIVVEIQDVVSPSIVQRLNLESGLFRAQIPDWLAVFDCVLIDTAYDGEVFNVCFSDVPERKQDLVQGRYELPSPPEGSTVAVKVIDMLGEEIVVVGVV